MAKEIDYENLKKIGKKTQFSGERAAEMGRKGQKASTEAKRRKKTAQELATAMLNCTLQGKPRTKVEQLFGDMAEEDITVLSGMIAGQVMAAMSGNTKAFNAMVDLMGISNEQQKTEHHSIMDAIKASVAEDEPEEPEEKAEGVDNGNRKV